MQRIKSLIVSTKSLFGNISTITNIEEMEDSMKREVIICHMTHTHVRRSWHLQHCWPTSLWQALLDNLYFVILSTNHANDYVTIQRCWFWDLLQTILHRIIWTVFFRTTWNLKTCKLQCIIFLCRKLYRFHPSPFL